MDRFAEPIEYVLRCCEQGLIPYHFDILNAKDQLKRMNKQEEIFFPFPVAWSRINERGDFFDFRTLQNSYIKNIVPLFVKTTDVEQAVQNISSIK